MKLISVFVSIFILFSGVVHSSQNRKAYFSSTCNNRPANYSKKFNLAEPAITPLPFGPKVPLNKLHLQSKYYGNLIYPNVGKLVEDMGFTPKTLKNIKLYQLPKITKVSYLRVGQDADQQWQCKNGKPLESMLKLTHYRYRLPNVGKYRAYYMCSYDYFGREQLDITKNYCTIAFSGFYGYLVLFDPGNSSAQVIPIYFDSFSGDSSMLCRAFKIDKDFTIHLIDSTVYDTDEPIILGRYILKLGADGTFKIKKTI
jgi:hypothetical protein